MIRSSSAALGTALLIRVKLRMRFLQNWFSQESVGDDVLAEWHLWSRPVGGTVIAHIQQHYKPNTSNASFEQISHNFVNYFSSENNL